MGLKRKRSSAIRGVATLEAPEMPAHHPGDADLFRVNLDCNLTYDEFNELVTFFTALKEKREANKGKGGGQ